MLFNGEWNIGVFGMFYGSEYNWVLMIGFGEGLVECEWWFNLLIIGGYEVFIWYV